MAETQTFKEAYSVLQRHAETLRRQTEPGIDDLLLIVEQSVVAYKVCKDRIDAVEKALQKALVDVGDSPAEGDSGAPLSPMAPSRAESVQGSEPRASAAAFDDIDDNVPF